jgi:hypothetical protein
MPPAWRWDYEGGKLLLLHGSRSWTLMLLETEMLMLQLQTISALKLMVNDHDAAQILLLPALLIAAVGTCSWSVKLKLEAAADAPTAQNAWWWSKLLPAGKNH